MQSKTSLFLPMLRTAFFEGFLEAAEKSLFDIEEILEGFEPKLRSDTVPDEWLNWLFYALGGEDYLRDDFDDTRKRNALKRIFDLYKGRGTFPGMDLHWQLLVDNRLLKANQPPSKSFCGLSLTEGERKEFEKNHPEIRVYPFKSSGEKHSFFIRDCFGDPDENYSVFPAQTDALLRIGEAVELYDPLADESTALHFFQYDKEHIERKTSNVVEVRLKGKAVGLFCGNILKGFTIDHGAKKRLYRLQLAGIFQDEITKRIPLAATPSLIPFRMFYEEVKVSGDGRGFFLANRYPDVYPDTGGSFLPSFFVRRLAGERIYKKFKLFDPARVSFAQRTILAYMGAFRLGVLPPHTAEAYVDMLHVKPKKAFFITGFANGFYYKSDAGERIEKMRWAGNLARRAGSKIKIQTKNRKPIRALSSVVAGQYRVGEYRLEVI